MDECNGLIDVRKESAGGGGGTGWKMVKGSAKEQTRMHNPETQTTVWGWLEGGRDGGWVAVGNRNIRNSVNNKIKRVCLCVYP